jgi:hypothetical protein
MKMIDKKLQDISRGFGVIEVLRNFVVTTGSTREECYEYLRNTDER